MNTDRLPAIAESVREYFDSKHRAREEALALSREVVRLSANSIRATHRRDFQSADTLIERAKANLAQIEQALEEHRDIFHAGFVHDAQKEYAEACCTVALIGGRVLPFPNDLGVMSASYLNGLGEAVGELRRHLLDALRQGDIKHCEESLSAMSDIYDMLVTMDYPEAVTAGLRRTTDSTRGLLERTRGDFTAAFVQRRLEEKLDALSSRLGQ